MSNFDTRFLLKYGTMYYNICLGVFKMLGFIEIIFSIVGLIGLFNDNVTLMIIGLVLIIIGDFIDIFITRT